MYIGPQGSVVLFLSYVCTELKFAIGPFITHTEKVKWLCFMLDLAPLHPLVVYNVVTGIYSKTS